MNMPSRYSNPSATADITVEKPYFRWLFGGFGFQHSEANFTPLMAADFRDERVLKTFAELSPTFGRVYTGFADESREQLDRFADYYDATFRKAGTTLYAVPCAMPAFADRMDAGEYAEKVAANLEYLVRGRNCRKIRYYCLTNECMCGDDWAWFSAKDERRELFKKFTEALFFAFRKHSLDIRIVASDEPECTAFNPGKVFPFLDWIGENMGDYVGAYCTHWYVYGREASDTGLWEEGKAYFSSLVQRALSRKTKRYILGEYGFSPVGGKRGTMVDDTGYSLRQPETCAEAVLSKCEIGLSAMNEGALACLSWSFVDYPDPFAMEDGDTPEERARFEAGKCGYRMDTKYNKWGAFRWCTTDRDYSAYPELYAMGWLVKLFRKNSTVLPCAFADPLLRGGAVMNQDRSVSIAIVNRGQARAVTVDCSSWKERVDGTPALHQPLRRYVYEAENVPENPFNDLQPVSGTVRAKDGWFTVELPAKSIVFLTTDYEDRVPAAVQDVRLDGGVLRWKESTDTEHRYYRVFRDGKQIASTVAIALDLASKGVDPAAATAASFRVVSVDRWNNEGGDSGRIATK